MWSYKSQHKNNITLRNCIIYIHTRKHQDVTSSSHDVLVLSCMYSMICFAASGDLAAHLAVSDYSIIHLAVSDYSMILCFVLLCWAWEGSDPEVDFFSKHKFH